MRVWIDQDLCTGGGLCEEIAPDLFALLPDGLAYVREGDTIFADANGNPQGSRGLAVVPAGQEDITIESAEESGRVHLHRPPTHRCCEDAWQTTEAALLGTELNSSEHGLDGAPRH